MSGPVIYLGTGNPAWLERAGVPLCVSDVRLRNRRRLPRAIAPWILDSGGFTQLQKAGRWTHSAADYADRVRRYRDEIGQLAWAAPMDAMCEQPIIHGGWHDRQYFVGTRQFVDPDHVMTDEDVVRVHQRQTVDNFVALRVIAPDLPFVPVLQGDRASAYMACIQMYGDAGIDLAREPVVGVGSVCRLQSTDRIQQVIHAIRGCGVRNLHGFGVKLEGLRRCGHLLASADSQAWSIDQRYKSGPTCGQPHPRGAKNCANCLPAALAWRERTLRLAEEPRQLDLRDCELDDGIRPA